MASPDQTKILVKSYCLLTFTALCWGANTTFGKLAVHEIPPMMLVSIRWMGALLLMLVFARSYLVRDWPVIRERLFFISVLATMGFTGFNVLFYKAAYLTTALNIGIIQGSIPIIVLVASFYLYRIRVSALQLGGVFITVSGVVIVAFKGDLSQIGELVLNHGDLLILAACFLYAAYTTGLRKRPNVSALGLFTVLAGVAFIVSLPFSISEYAMGASYWPSTQGWVVVVLVTVFPSFLAQIFFIQGVEALGPNRAGVFINLVPVFAAIFAVVILGEPFELFHGMALVLVLGGIWLSEYGKQG
jgi:drug/metabolite transporter (DMT)-like permease